MRANCVYFMLLFITFCNFSFAQTDVEKQEKPEDKAGYALGVGVVLTSVSVPMIAVAGLWLKKGHFISTNAHGDIIQDHNFTPEGIGLTVAGIAVLSGGVALITYGGIRKQKLKISSKVTSSLGILDNGHLGFELSF